MKTDAAAPQAPQTLVWVDLEMTGLDPQINTVIEVAAIITDFSLNIIAEGADLIIHHDPSVYATMDQWNQHQHRKSGLWQQAEASTIDTTTAEDQLLAFISQHVKKGEGILAGNSIWQDRRFINNYFPRVDAYLHYRMLDVSSFKIMFSHWYAHTYSKKKDGHRARQDIQESIAELRFYRGLLCNNLDPAASASG
jgi:oligoribonuclease